MYQQYLNAVQRHYPKLKSVRSQFRLLMAATCFPAGSPEQVEEDLLELKKNTNGTLDAALAYADAKLTKQMNQREKSKETGAKNAS